MKIIAALLLVSSFTGSQDQDRSGLSSSQVNAIVASFKNRKLSENDLIPNGFTRVAAVKADLNQDGIDDLALIIREKPSAQTNEGPDNEVLPQAVLLFLGNQAGTFSFWKIGPHHFVDSNPNFMEEGGVGTFAIKKGVLQIQSSTIVSMGSWFAGGCTQKWRNEKSGLRLIGLTVAEIDRKCACGETRDMNYLTGDEVRTSDKDAHGEQTRKIRTTKARKSPRVILWEEFAYDTFCTL